MGTLGYRAGIEAMCRMVYPSVQADGGGYINSWNKQSIKSSHVDGIRARDMRREVWEEI